MSFDTIIILAVLAFALFTISRNNPMNYDKGYRRRRFLNWFPLGLTYAFLYMGRYNLTVAKMAFGDLMTKADFGTIFAAGAWVYAFAFIVNGPLTDKLGGRFSILAAAIGTAAMNFLMGLETYLVLVKGWDIDLVLSFSILYSLNMYFQSFGAVSIVKVNATWFHIKERGVFGGIFGILISLGIYLAFDWGSSIVNSTLATVDETKLTWLASVLRLILVPEGATINATWWIFYIPAFILMIFFFIDLAVVRNKPSDAGQKEIETADASSGHDDKPIPTLELLKSILTNKVIIIIGLIQICSGVLRQGLMHWYPIYMDETNKKLVSSGVEAITFFKENWGLLLMVAGVIGGMLAGFISDKIFGSRRGPVAALLYVVTLVAVILMTFTMNNYYVLGAMAVLGSVAIIGVHGMLAGTATMDFGGKRAAGTATGVVDGFVYLGTGLQSVCLGYITSKDWSYWPPFLAAFAVIGLLFAIKIWRAFPNASKKAAH